MPTEHSAGFAKERRKTKVQNGLAYRILSNDATNTLMSLPVEEAEQAIAQMFCLPDLEIDLKQGAIVSYYSAAIHWSVSSQLSLEAASAFFTMAYELLGNVANNMSLTSNLVHFKGLLSLSLGSEDEDTAENSAFDIPTLKDVCSYIDTCLFQHYNLFKYLFSGVPNEYILRTNVLLETSGSALPCPLDEGIPVDLFETCFCLPAVVSSEELRKLEEEKRKEKELEKQREEELEKQREEERISRLIIHLETMEPAEIREIIESVANELLSDMQAEVGRKLAEKETYLLTLVNNLFVTAVEENESSPRKQKALIDW